MSVSVPPPAGSASAGVLIHLRVGLRMNDRNEYLVRAGTFSKNPRKTGGFFVYRGNSICVPYEGLLSKFGKNDLAYPAGINNKGQVLMLAQMGKRVRTFLLTPKG
jgi:hypothetical protein